jgi:hypothetical protein
VNRCSKQDWTMYNSVCFKSSAVKNSICQTDDMERVCCKRNLLIWKHLLSSLFILMLQIYDHTENFVNYHRPLPAAIEIKEINWLRSGPTVHLTSYMIGGSLFIIWA